MTDATKFLTTEDVAGLANVSPATIRSYVSRGYMPRGESCRCCGHSPVWRRRDIEKWLAKRPGQGAGGGRPRKDAK